MHCKETLICNQRPLCLLYHTCEEGPRDCLLTLAHVATTDISTEDRSVVRLGSRVGPPYSIYMTEDYIEYCAKVAIYQW